MGQYCWLCIQSFIGKDDECSDILRKMQGPKMYVHHEKIPKNHNNWEYVFIKLQVKKDCFHLTTTIDASANTEPQVSCFRPLDSVSHILVWTTSKHITKYPFSHSLKLTRWTRPRRDLIRLGHWVSSGSDYSCTYSFLVVLPPVEETVSRVRRRTLKRRKIL